MFRGRNPQPRAFRPGGSDLGAPTVGTNATIRQSLGGRIRIARAASATLLTAHRLQFSFARMPLPFTGIEVSCPRVEGKMGRRRPAALVLDLAQLLPGYPVTSRMIIDACIEASRIRSRRRIPCLHTAAGKGDEKSQSKLVHVASLVVWRLPPWAYAGVPGSSKGGARGEELSWPLGISLSNCLPCRLGVASKRAPPVRPPPGWQTSRQKRWYPAHASTHARRVCGLQWTS